MSDDLTPPEYGKVLEAVLARQRLEAERATDGPLAGDRGVRTVEVSLDEYGAFGAAIRAYQAAHPDTLVRTTARGPARAGVMHMTVRWWQRGTAQP